MKIKSSGFGEKLSTLFAEKFCRCFLGHPKWWWTTIQWWQTQDAFKGTRIARGELDEHDKIWQAHIEGTLVNLQGLQAFELEFIAKQFRKNLSRPKTHADVTSKDLRFVVWQKVCSSFCHVCRAIPKV